MSQRISPLGTERVFEKPPLPRATTQAEEKTREVAKNRILPDPGCFGTGTHKELAEASGHFEKQCPRAPKRRGRVSDATAPAVKRSGSELTMSCQWLRGRAGLLSNIELEIGPGNKKKVQVIRFLDQGDYSDVYQCRVEGEEVDSILKVLKQAKISGCVGIFANRLLRYAQNMADPFLKNHVARHRNLDSHLEPTEGFLGLGPEERYEKFKEYVEKSFHQGFLLAEFIPQKFPVDFNKEDSRWIQLKEIIKAGYEAGISNEPKRSNVRVSDEGKVYIIDLHEVEGRSVGGLTLRNCARSYTDKPEEQAWLLPEAELGKDRAQDLFSDVGSNDGSKPM